MKKVDFFINVEILVQLLQDQHGNILLESPRQDYERICRYYDLIVDPTKVEVSLQSL